jgi:hypothetical protein
MVGEAITSHEAYGEDILDNMRQERGDSISLRAVRKYTQLRTQKE